MGFLLFPYMGMGLRLAVFGRLSSAIKGFSYFYWVAVGEPSRELKQTTTATATGTLLNKRFNEQNNSCARAL